MCNFRKKVYAALLLVAVIIFYYLGNKTLPNEQATPLSMDKDVGLSIDYSVVNKAIQQQDLICFSTDLDGKKEIEISQMSDAEIRFDISGLPPNQLVLIKFDLEFSNLVLADQNSSIRILPNHSVAAYNKIIYDEYTIDQEQDIMTDFELIGKTNQQGVLEAVIGLGSADEQLSGNFSIVNLRQIDIERSEEYTLVSSSDQIVNILFERQLLDCLDDQDLNALLEKLSTCRKTFVKFFGSVDHCTTTDYIIINSFPYYALADEVIYVNVDEFRREVIDTKADLGTVAWKMIHEMSHTFDPIFDKTELLFDAEFFADFKMFFILRQHAIMIYRDEEYIDPLIFFGEFNSLSNSVYSSRGLVYKMLEILLENNLLDDLAGLSEVFEIYYALEVTSYDKYQSFEAFLEILSEKYEFNFFDYFDENELSAVKNAYETK